MTPSPTRLLLALACCLALSPAMAAKVTKVEVKGLADEGLLQIEPGVGTVVAQSPEPSRAQKKQLLEGQLGELVVEARRMSLSQEDVLEAVKELWTNNQGKR